MKIDERTPPNDSLIAPYAAMEGHYADCFVAVGARADLPDLIGAFYTQPLFKAERLVLRVAAGAPSTDADVAALARGDTDRLAVWTVARRTGTEILLTDASGRTMSWLRAGDDVAFGSVIVPVRDRWGRLTLGPVFQSLVGAHKLYSRALLAGAVSRLRRRQAV